MQNLPKVRTSLKLPKVLVRSLGTFFRKGRRKSTMVDEVKFLFDVSQDLTA